MRKRLRKKKRVGEFQELGFELSFRYEPSGIEGDDALLDAFILEAIEASGLLFGGGGGHGQWSGFATRDARRGSATETQREQVQAWLEQQQRVTEFHVGALRDASTGW